MFNNQSIFDKLCTCLWQAEPCRTHVISWLVGIYLAWALLMWYHVIDVYWFWKGECLSMLKLSIKRRWSVPFLSWWTDGIQHKTEQSRTSHQSEFLSIFEGIVLYRDYLKMVAVFQKKCLLTKFTRSRWIAQLSKKRAAWGQGYHQTETTRIRNSHPRTTLAVAEHRALLSEYFVEWVWTEEFCP